MPEEEEEGSWDLIGKVFRSPTVLVLAAVYLGLVWVAAKRPDLHIDDPADEEQARLYDDVVTT